MADGSIIIDTRIDTGGVSKGMNAVKAGMTRISAQVSKMGDSAKSSFQRQITAITDLYQNYEKQERKVSELKSKLEELSKVRIETEEYKKLKDDMKTLEDEFEKIEAKQREWLDMGFSINSAPLKELDKQMDDIWADIDRLQRKQKEMQATGRAYVDPTSTDAYKGTAEKYNTESQKLERINGRLYSSYNNLKNKVEEYRQKNNRLAQAMQNLQKAAARVGMVVKNMGSALRSAGSSIKSMVSAMKKAVENMFNLNKQTNRSRMSLSRMLGMSLLFSGVFRAISAVSDGVKTGFENLAQYSNSTNSAISSLMSSMTRLKNSFATAFAPVLTVVAPIMSRFIDMISRAITYVGMFAAALTGQDTFVKAVGVQEDYAASLDKTSKNAKKASKQTKSYLSSLDEVHKASTSGSAGTDDSGGYKAPTPGQMFETVPIANSIKGIADKIKKLIKAEDWEGLGAYIASGINKGLQKVYDAINWKKVGPQITKFCNAFTRTFNSLVNHIDWDLMGRTVGAGINTIVNTLNLLITGINWKNLGKKFATGIAGFVREVNWNNLGQLIGNRFMIAWNIFNGMVHNLPYKEIGQAVADGLNGAVSRFSLSEIGDTLATGLNGAFTSLYSFTERFDWSELVNNIAGGINTFVSEFDWKANGRKLEAFLDNLCGSLVDMAEKTDWEAFGKGVGDMLTQVDWLGHLKQVIKAVVKSLGGLFDGMEASGTAGKIAAFLGKAFIAVKIADITGISDLIKLLLKAIGKKLIGSEAIGELSGNLTTLLGNAVKGAAGSFTSLASAITPLVGTAGLIAGVGVAAAAATSELAKMVETMQGGNGVGGTFGNTMDNFIQTLQRRGDIISGSATEIWNLKESLEKEGMTAEEKSSATQKLIDKLGEMGVTSDQAEQAFSTLYQQGLITDDMFDILSESIKTLGDNTTNMAGSIDLSKQSIDDLYDNVLPQLQTQLGLSADQVTSLDTALLETESAGGTAQDAFNNIMERAEEMGLNTESVAKIFAQVFPDAVKETANSAEISMSSTQSSIETGMGAAATAVGTAMFGIQTDTEKAMSAAERAVSDSTGNISTDSEINWAAAEGFATGSVEEVGRTTYENMKAVYGVVSRYNASIKDDFDTNWGDSQNTVINAIQGMADEIERNGDRLASGVKNAFSGIPGYITDILNNAVGKVNSAIGNINGALGSIERSFTFTYNYTNPFNNRRNTYRSYLNLNRANTVPYLASGAVIPPRSEFLAVLGDQKNGRNLEAPEDLLRQIVREEAGGKQGGSGNVRFTAQINRRTIFDEVIEEAKLRRDASGTNPFELS
ncbi:MULTISPECIES: hypothetical protein [unclassified Ruminococcus]|uniref:hypothetical protein n=1 Tax=unclassified Ruminococcus TaxID=2608920 RepID=UPI00319E777C